MHNKEEVTYKMKRHIRLRGHAPPTERISSFVDDLIQPTAKIRKLYLKDTTEFLNFIEKTKVAKKNNPCLNGR